MPKGKHKGGRRQFTDFNAESIKKEKEARELEWRAQRGEVPTDDEEEKEKSGSEEESEEEESSDSSSEEESEEEEAKVPKAKGVSGLIELENPNRQGTKTNRKVTDLNVPATAGAGAGAAAAAAAGAASSGKPQLSRREREELEKQRATANYRKLHAAGKTEEARADLERLAIIKQKRAEAEQKRKDQIDAKTATAASSKGGKQKS